MDVSGYIWYGMKKRKAMFSHRIDTRILRNAGVSDQEWIREVLEKVWKDSGFSREEYGEIIQTVPQGEHILIVHVTLIPVEYMQMAEGNLRKFGRLGL